MSQILQWRDYSAFKQSVRLSNVLYILRGRWNTSRAYWTIDILDRNGVPILLGQKIVLGTEILGRYNNPALPPGRLFAMEITNINQVLPDGEVVARIGRDDIGERVLLVYDDDLL